MVADALSRIEISSEELKNIGNKNESVNVVTRSQTKKQIQLTELETAKNNSLIRSNYPELEELLEPKK